MNVFVGILVSAQILLAPAKLFAQDVVNDVVEEIVVEEPTPTPTPTPISTPEPTPEVLETPVVEKPLETTPSPTPVITPELTPTPMPVPVPMNTTNVEEMDEPEKITVENTVQNSALGIEPSAKPGNPSFTFEALYADGDPFVSTDWTTGNPCSGQHDCYQEEGEMALRITITELPRLDDEGNVITYTLGLQHEYYRAQTDVYGYISYYQDPVQGLILPSDSNTSDANLTYLGTSSCPGNVTCKDYEMTFTVDADGVVVLYFMVSIGENASEWGNGNNDASLQATLNGFTPGNGNGGSHTIPNQIEPKIDPAYLTICKDVIGPDSEDITNDDTEFDIEVTRDDNNDELIYEGQISDTEDGCVTVEVDPGTYTVEEINVPEEYELISCVESPVTLDEEDEATVTCTNQLSELPVTAELTICKDVIAADQSDITNDETLFDIEVRDIDEELVLEGQISDTEEGCITTEVEPGTYSVEEINVSEDYEALGCVESPVTVEAGDSVEIICTNQLAEDTNEGNPLLFITKSNDAPGPLVAGDQVTYTITVRAEESVDDVYVTDVPPAGFTYRPGTWNSVSTERGSIKGSVTIQPVYGEYGTWYLGDMVDGEIVTLTYIADISTSQQDGDYPDIAWAEGVEPQMIITNLIAPSSHGGQHVYANTDTGYFVGTSVEIISIAQAGQVLGAHTVSLPATGIAANLTVLSILGLLAGALLVVSSYTTNMKKFFFLMGNMRKAKLVGYSLILGTVFFGSALFLGNVSAADADFMKVSVEQPASPTNVASLELNFVALDINDNALNIECFMKKNGGAAVLFDSETTAAGGGNGVCTANVSENATYNLYAVASHEGASKQSNIVTVVYDGIAPGSLQNFTKEKVGSCSYKISFNVQSGTEKIEIYRTSTNTFNSSDKVKSESVGAGFYTYTDNIPASECKDDMFYIARAVDNAGNASSFSGDTTRVIVIQAPSTNTGTNTNNGAGNIGTDNGQVEGITDEQTENEENTEENETENGGSVLAEQDENNGSSSNNDNKDEKSSKSPMILIGGGLLLLVVIGGLSSMVFLKRK